MRQITRRRELTNTLQWWADYWAEPQQAISQPPTLEAIGEAVNVALEASRLLGGAGAPQVVCLCGSTKFKEAFEAENRRLTLEGKIVLSVGLFAHREPDFDWGLHKQRLDELHRRKIDMADEVFVVNVGGYIGHSTSLEIEYARSMGKPVVFLEPEATS